VNIGAETKGAGAGAIVRAGRSAAKAEADIMARAVEARIRRFIF
jgi:cell division GTPase FtsZ